VIKKRKARGRIKEEQKVEKAGKGLIIWSDIRMKGQNIAPLARVSVPIEIDAGTVK